MRVPPELLRGSPYTAGGRAAAQPLRRAHDRRPARLGDPAPRDRDRLRGQGAAVGQAGDAARRRHGDDDRRRPRDPPGAGGRGARGVGRARAEQGRRREAGARRAATARAGARDDGDAKPAAKSAPARKPGDDKPPAAKASYLLTLARVKELYRTRQYELALVELVELDRQYPEDEHILSMKGSLYERLGQQEPGARGVAADAAHQPLQPRRARGAAAPRQVERQTRCTSS